MRKSRIILTVAGLILVGFVVLAFVSIAQRQWGHSRFLSRDQSYYAQVAQACDSLRKAQTIAPDGFVTMTGSEESISKIIRDLNPGKIIITQKGVTILVGRGRPDFGITWKQDDSFGTNQWTLSTAVEGDSKVVYRLAF
jgi:hypothetical protein